MEPQNLAIGIKINIILLITTLAFSQASWAMNKEKRVQAAFAAIGAFVVENQDKEFTKSEVQLKGTDLAQVQGIATLSKYYAGNSDAYYESVSESKATKKLIEVGKAFTEKIMQKMSKPVCEKLKICKLSCYVDVTGDVIDLILAANPKLLFVKTAFQTYIVDGGMKYLSRLCKC